MNAALHGVEHEGRESCSKHLCPYLLLRWGYAVADDFFTKQLPHNVTWGLTMLYALDHSTNFSNTAVQVSFQRIARYRCRACSDDLGQVKASALLAACWILILFVMRQELVASC